jgi:hypothetical protein
VAACARDLRCVDGGGVCRDLQGPGLGPGDMLTSSIPTEVGLLTSLNKL